VRQVLLNLLSNAVKFTDRGEVLLTLNLARTPEAPTCEPRADLRFAVRDSGIGIAPERVGTLFAPFTQADGSTTRKFGGTGLGLSISRRLAEAMGGSIAVESAVGSGSTFHFAVSLPPTAGVSPDGAADRLDDVSVLIVAEHALNRASLERLLTRRGCTVSLAITAQDGLARYRSMIAEDRTPAAVILDYHLPDQNGAWLAAAIRALPAPPASLILLTTLSTSLLEDVGRLVDRVLAKPAKPSVLIQAIGELTRAFRPAVPVGVVDAAPRNFSGMRVLLAEDNVVNQKLATRLLQQRGADVHVVGNGAEALRALSEADFDVVLMDCQMPEMDGYEATRRLRHWPGLVRNPHIPVVALTAHALATDRAKCLAAGMNDYLTKPVDPTRLQQALTQAMLSNDRRRAHIETAALFDEQAVLERTGNDTEFARELIALFVTSASETLARMGNALQSNADPGEIRRLAHSLKGSAATVAAAAVASRAADIERTTGDADLRAAVRLLMDAFDATVSEWQCAGWARAAAS
jgi:two-component system, sensor histidine kinase and response regulator